MGVNMSYRLRLRYVYTFYSFGEELAGDVIDESVEVGEEKRFTLHQQEDSSFVLSPIGEDYKGKYVIVTYPNKDNVKVYLDREEELVYDEYFDSMGDDDHNVYEGTMILCL